MSTVFKSIAKPFAQSVITTEERIDPDGILVERVKGGEVAAFDALVLKYRERLYSVIYNLTSNREDAADLAQDAFIKAFRSINKFRGKSLFYTWLYRIAINETLSYIRKNRRRRFFSLEILPEKFTHCEIIEILAVRAHSNKSIIIKELQEKLNEALQSLSTKHRTTIILYEVEDLSHREIAEIMNTSVGTVRSRLHYAKERLQSLLAEFIDKK